MKLVTLPVGDLLTNCYLLAAQSGRAAVIDPGDDPERIADRLDKEGMTPAMILLTHGHFDHIGAVKELAARYALPVYGSEADLVLFTDLKRNRALYIHGDPQRYHVVPDHLVQDGDTIPLEELSLQVIATPGHTPGGVCYRCGEFLFTGDTLFAGSIGRCDMFGGDYPALLRSLDRLDRLEGEYTVFPGHGGETTLTYEKAANPFFGEMRRLRQQGAL